MIAIHFGLGEYSTEHAKIIKNKRISNDICLRSILELQNGASSLETVCNTVSALENCKFTNAGVGSSLNLNGNVEMEASIMEGNSGLFGGVSCIKNYKNPVEIAKHVLLNQMNAQLNWLISPQYLSGEGAENFAKKQNILPCSIEILKTNKTKKRYEKYKNFASENADVESKSCQKNKNDTVGAICCDTNGNISVAASSGGMFLKPQGRIGHVSLPSGSGIWVDRLGKTAVCTTGVGELLAKDITARKVCELMTIDSDYDFDIVDRFKEHIKKLENNPASWPVNVGFLGLKICEGGSKKVISCLTSSKLLIGFCDQHALPKTYLLQHHNSQNNNPVIQEWLLPL